MDSSTLRPPGDLQPAPAGLHGSALDEAPASPILPAGHWAFAALRRLGALGLLAEAFDPGTPALTCAAAGALFRQAASRAAERPRDAGLASAYDSLFAADPEGCPVQGRPAAATVAASWKGLKGRVASGVGYEGDDWTGAQPQPDTTTPLLTGRLSLVTPHASVAGAPELASGGLRLSEGQLVLAGGGLGFWAGRRRFRFGPAVGGGIVVSDAVAFEGAGAYLPRPIHFPWIFRAMGPIRLETFLSRVKGGDRIQDPYFIGFRGTMSPHSRLVVGLSRAAMFGGKGNDPITLRNLQFLVLSNLGAGRSYRFANDMLSVDVQWRPALGGAPLLTYVELGMDDAAGAWHHEPGVVAGAYLGALPLLRTLGGGVEWTFFAPHYFQNTIWYRNAWLRHGWTDAGRAVGSPVAGQGQQAMAYVDGIGGPGRLQGRLAVFYRYRGPENLLAPARQGFSRGVSGRVQLQAARSASLYADVDADFGHDWTESEIIAGMILRLR